MGLFESKDVLKKSGIVGRINFIAGQGDATSPAYGVIMLEGDSTLYDYYNVKYSDAKSAFITKEGDEIEFSVLEGSTNIITESFCNKSLK